MESNPMIWIEHYFDMKDNKTLRVRINSKKLPIVQPIGQSIQIDNLLIARIKVTGQETPTRNVVAFDLDGNHFWTIQELKSKMPYGGIWIEGGKLMAYDTLGVDYFVNLQDGSTQFVRCSK